MRLDDLFDNRQAQPGAVFFAAGVVSSILTLGTLRSTYSVGWKARPTAGVGSVVERLLAKEKVVGSRANYLGSKDVAISDVGNLGFANSIQLGLEQKAVFLYAYF